MNSVITYVSDTEWPSYHRAIDGHVSMLVDNAYGMRSIAVVCRRLGGHLGHVFEHGPEGTGKRFCINSASFDFLPKKSGDFLELDGQLKHFFHGSIETPVVSVSIGRFVICALCV